MKSNRDFSIPFTGLKLGKHQFEYAVTDAFFNGFEYSLVKNANIICSVELEKQETMIILHFHITGTINANCDRCLAKYPQHVDIREQQVIKFGDEATGEDEDIIVLSKNEHEIELSGLIYEYINVALPYITVCIDEGNTPYCDKEMLDSLNKLSANTDKAEKLDPRWDALKNIK